MLSLQNPTKRSWMNPAGIIHLFYNEVQLVLSSCLIPADFQTECKLTEMVLFSILLQYKYSLGT